MSQEGKVLLNMHSSENGSVTIFHFAVFFCNCLCCRKAVWKSAFLLVLIVHWYGNG
jgi:hypothetical protein